ncbi:MAG: glutamyl-tRNA reductase [Campylobacterota bacterium]|nr:glutamyl-tRNA reductase [Campylobacterota bacterium]
MHYLTISFTHKNSTLEIREKLAYPDNESLNGCLTKLTSSDVVNESMLLSTCNRMEIFCSCSNVLSATEHIFKMLHTRSQIPIDELEGRADIYEDQGAIHHLFAVTSSLDSMVVGETQIVGQLKEAYSFAIEHNYCGKKVTRAIEYALKCAAEVRNITDISSKPVSVASVAISKAKQEIGNIDSKKALVIGAGEMSVIIVKHLQKNGLQPVLTNRTHKKALDLADELECEVLEFEKLSSAINEYELIFTSTGAYEPIIQNSMVEDCNFQRYWFDIAVPRDIEDISNKKISIFRVDDLKSIIETNINMREDEARAAFAVTGRYTMQFFEYIKSLSIEPLIKELYVKALKDAQAESSRAIKNGYIPREYEEQVNKLANQSIKRFLHDISTQLRKNTKQNDTQSISEAFNFLLGE